MAAGCNGTLLSPRPACPGPCNPTPPPTHPSILQHTQPRCCLAQRSKRSHVTGAHPPAPARGGCTEAYTDSRRHHWCLTGALPSRLRNSSFTVDCNYRMISRLFFEQGPEFIRNRTNTAEEHTAVYHTVQTSTTHGPIEHRLVFIRFINFVITITISFVVFGENKICNATRPPPASLSLGRRLALPHPASPRPCSGVTLSKNLWVYGPVSKNIDLFHPSEASRIIMLVARTPDAAQGQLWAR